MTKCFVTCLFWASVALAAIPVPENCLAGYQALGIDDAHQRAAAIARYHLVEASARHGYSGEAIPGSLPADFNNSIPSAPADWTPGMKVMVKIPIPRGGKWTPANQWALVHESNVSEKIAPLDPKGLFVRMARDAQLNVDVMKYASSMIPMREWLGRQGEKISPAGVKSLESQLDEALEILKLAGIVHSDLNPSNVLIDPKTLKIQVIDYGISAPVGGYAPHLRHITRNDSPIRGGVMPYMSLKQARGEPAIHEDDAHAVWALKQDIETHVQDAPGS